MLKLPLAAVLDAVALHMCRFARRGRRARAKVAFIRGLRFSTLAAIAECGLLTYRIKEGPMKRPDFVSFFCREHNGPRLNVAPASSSPEGEAKTASGRVSTLNSLLHVLRCARRGHSPFGLGTRRCRLLALSSALLCASVVS